MTQDQKRNFIGFIAAGSFSGFWWIAQKVLEDALPELVKTGIMLVFVLSFAIFGLLWLSTFFKDSPTDRTAPDARWLPLHIAPFKLASSPSYQTLYQLWRPHFFDLALPGQPDPQDRIIRMTVKDAVTKSDAMDQNGLVPHSYIDWENGAFRLGYSTPRDDGDAWAVRYLPWELGKDHRPDQLTPEVWEKVRKNFLTVWDHMLMRGLGDLIENDHVQVWARFGSAQNPYTKLDGDAWKHFQVTDIRTGRASGEGEDRLFSIHIEPLRGSIDPAKA
jgi:hypothetical protein